MNKEMRMREVLLVVLAAAALFLLLALFTYHPSDPAWSTTGSSATVANLAGRTGAYLADLLLYFLGYPAYSLPFAFALISWWLMRRSETAEDTSWWLWILGLVLSLVFLSCLCELWLSQLTLGLPLSAGGVIGNFLAASLAQSFGMVGGSVIAVALVLSGFTLAFGLIWTGSVLRLCKGCWSYFVKLCTPRPRPPVMDLPPVTPKVPPKLRPKPAPELAPEPVKPVAPKVSKSPRTPVADTGDPIPPLSLLDDPTHQVGQLSAEELKNLGDAVVLRLSEFGIPVKVVGIEPGPVVTRFELEPAPGLKASRLTGIAKDLARSLSKTSVRVVEVVPGKAVIGLEIPNPEREVVRLKEVLESPVYQDAKSPITLGLGKDISGSPVAVDLARMPHLLVAGTTGSGKSVSVNAMLLSFLFKATPQELRLIMIDPKMLELSIYEGIPHLLTPVVTDMKDAANALRWCVFEMDRRYRLMSTLSVRNLAGYNQKITAALEAGQPILDPFIMGEGIPESERQLKTLPQIVVVIDELADLMMVVGKKVEELIARIAQKARAAGIHMILATQRPSVDVITGLIKANIPTRIAFQVSSRIDSRTILDQQGAEQLLGYGDMLYMPPGTSVPIRVHGAFVSDEEVVRVVEAWKSRGEAEYVEEILSGGEAQNEDGSAANFGGDNPEADPLYDEAVALVTETRRASISLVQRKLRIGYNRAATLLEVMEAAGVVSPMESNGLREVLAPAPPRED